MREWLEAALPMLGRLRSPAVVHPRPCPEASERLLADVRFDEPIPLHEAARVVETILGASTRTAHPRYFGWSTPSPLESAAVADLLVSHVNPQLAVRASAPLAVAAEERILADLAGFFGLPPAATGAFTGGGSEANLSAMVVALTARVPGYADAGLAGIPRRPTFYVSEEAHHSLEKVALVTGLGRTAMRCVPTDDALAMDPRALLQLIEEDRRAGRAPFMVVATCGTTNAGAIDPLEAIGDLCAREGLWMHVDAAWGGAAAISARLRSLVSGIERADSIAFDPHKSLAMPLGTGVVLYRDRTLQRGAFCPSAPYVAPEEAPSDPYASSLSWSRRFIGLRLLLPLLTEGWGAFAERFERQAELGTRLARGLEEDGWEILHASPLATVCFADPPSSTRVPSPHAAIAEHVLRRGQAYISATRLRGRDGLRACITSRETTVADLERLREELAHARAAQGGGREHAAL